MRTRMVLVLALLLTVAGCARTGSGTSEAVPEIRPGLLKGYLAREALPNSLVLLPAPPPTGEAAFALDEDVARRSIILRGTRRWDLAIADADLRFPQAAGTYSCALGAPISEAQTPRLYLLLRRTLTDAGLATYAAKDHYHRPRPFMANGAPICTADERALLEKDGSYPSGHTAVGWAWALILTEIAPDRTEAILVRGRAYGESRNVCNVHWHSDVMQGLVLGAGVVARLHADPTFRADLEAAKAEVAAVRAQGLEPTRDCALEAAALAR